MKAERHPFELTPESLNLTNWQAKLAKPILPSLNRILGLTELENSYNYGINSSDDHIEAFKKILEYFGTKHRVYPNDLSSIPEEGPLVVVSNHPFGGLEAMILVHILSQRRRDIKFLANYLLGGMEELSDLFVLVDPFENESSTKKNITPLRDSMKWLSSGGCIIVFPAGTVSHLNLSKWEVQDPAWSPTIAALVRRSKASVVPFFIHGKNNVLFQIAGLIHPILRTILLPRQLVNKKGKKIRVQFGQTLSPKKLAKYEDDNELISYLRLRTYVQKNSVISPKKVIEKSKTPAKVSSNETQLPIAEPEDTEAIKGEIFNLPEKNFLLENKQFLVAYASAAKAPTLLQEIGRLREEAFRAAGEGSGKSKDLDWFDNYYDHLFCWDRQNNELVGAYRIGRTDEILKRYGRKGLYTYTLFKYSKHLLEQLGPALEMGRSFISPKYQKNYWSLLLLWKGIGQYVCRQEKYKVLFGPVSISDEYDSVSRQLMTSFLKANNFEATLAQLVKPRSPYPKEKFRGIDDEQMSKVVKDLGEVSELIANIEMREQAVPVLLKEYIKLGGKLLGFNVDDNFSSVLDGLIVVDLTQTKVPILERYMGKSEAREFLEYHQKPGDNTEEEIA